MDAAAFKGVVQNVLNRWSGLKLSVDHQSGGRQSKEKALYLVDYINEVLFTNSKVESEDLEDLITDYMDSELDTILEDNSVREVARVILHFFELFQTGRQNDLVLELNKLPHCDVWLDISYQAPKRRSTGVNGEGDGGSDSSSEGSDTEEAATGNGETQAEPMDCEWTEVTYRRKR